MNQVEFDDLLASFRDAPSGRGPHAYNWQDKPHRVLYDLCKLAEAVHAENGRLWAFIDDMPGGDDAYQQWCADLMDGEQ